MIPGIPIGPLGGLLGAGVAVNELKKAGQRKEVRKLVEEQLAAGGNLPSATGGFGYQTGYGPGMFGPTSGYQAIDRYNRQMGDTNRDIAIKNLLAIEPITDRAKTRDFERNMAAARYRTQLGTQQGLTLQGQMGAQKLAQQAQQGATTALASNYQYQ